MSYQKPEIWIENEKSQYGRSWRTSWEEAEAVYPELIKNLVKEDYKSKGIKAYDDGAKYTYKVSHSPTYGYTIWRNEKSNRGGGNSNRPRQFSQQTQKSTGQGTLSDTDVKYEELAAKTEQWMQTIDYKLNRLLQESNIDPAGIKPASSLKEDHGNEQGGDNASGLGMDIMNAVEEVTDDGLPEVETPSGVPEIDSIAGQEQEY